MPFGQTFHPHDLIIIGLLVVLEGVLSLDNALVLALLARRLPKFLRRRALTYGLIGAFVFRVAAICLAGFLLRWHWAKLIGGLYLLWVSGKYFAVEARQQANAQSSADDPAARSGKLDYAHAQSTHTRAFWTTVAVIELTDIAFAVDSIVAAVGTVPDRSKLWIVILGGMLGVALMRFAAVLFGKLLERFPRFETSAYLLVAVIGLKLVIVYFFPTLDFHSPRAWASWMFWAAMTMSLGYGFVPSRPGTDVAEARSDG